jgi:flagellin-like hook-associated protein FlgL
VGVRINTNTAALNTHRILARNDHAMGRSLERLSSGLRVNRAADDAAGLAISEGLRSEVGGLRQALRNTQDGISVVRTAEGALSETTSVLRRMRDLTVQAANEGALTSQARGAIQQEMDQLSEELTRIATTTSFNGTPLLDGSYHGTFQVGANVGETITIIIGGPGWAMDAEGFGLTGIDVTGAGAAAGSGATATATPAVSDEEGVPTSGRVSLAGDFITPGSLEASYRGLTGKISYNGLTFDLAGVDYTGAVTAQDYIDTINLAARAALGTTGMPVAATSGELLFTGDNPGPGSTIADGQRLSMRYAAPLGTDAALRVIDTAIGRVSSTRANLGAIENRLEHTVARLGVAAENTAAGFSRIRDLDMAEEMTVLVKHQVLSQAATAMLAHAHRAPQGILSLLN